MAGEDDGPRPSPRKRDRQEKLRTDQSVALFAVGACICVRSVRLQFFSTANEAQDEGIS
jgi:hypothetical protein